MRRILCIFFSCIILLSCLGCEAANDTTNALSTTAPTNPAVYDSLNIPQEEECLIRQNNVERIVRVLEVSRSILAEENAIERIASESKTAYYVILQPVNEDSIELRVECRKSQDGVSVEYKPSNFSHVWRMFMQYAVETHHFFDENVIVEHVYCLQEYAGYVYAPLIYYSTNQGDYVLYFDYDAGYEFYLFPAEIYSSIERKLLTSDLSAPPGVGGMRIDLDFVWNIEPYHIEQPEDFLFWIGVRDN